jgi:tRNA(fMet)-specific endonuclease VapC
MNGKRYLLDTNAIVSLLRGNPPLVQTLKDAEWIGISVISQIEFLAFANLSQHDKDLFDTFLNRVTIVGLTGDQTDFIKLITDVRQQRRLKLPDAIIVASALHNSAALVTADRRLDLIPQLNIIRI